jgi:hypothetical protein
VDEEAREIRTIHWGEAMSDHDNSNESPKNCGADEPNERCKENAIAPQTPVDRSTADEDGEHTAYNYESIIRKMLERAEAVRWEPIWRFVADSNHLLVIATWGGVIMSIIAVQGSDASLARSQRAWIAPLAMQFTEPLVSGQKQISVRVIYENTGKEPAIGIANMQSGKVIPLPPPPFDWDKLPVAENTTCLKLKPLPGQTVSYPSVPLAQYKQYDLSVNGENGSDVTSAAVDSILQARATIYVNGCFAYITSNTTHRSAYCFYLAPESGVPMDKWEFKNCATGNWAD